MNYLFQIVNTILTILVITINISPQITTITEIKEEIKVDTSFYENGNVKDIIHRNQNGWHGSWIQFDENGKKLKVSNYKDDKKDGEQYIYSEGFISQIELYKANEIVSSTSYNPNGNKSSEQEYKNGFSGGITKSTYYYENGNILSETYSKDYEVEKLINYYENGQKSLESKFKNREPEGKLLGWYEDGKISSEMNFKNGKPEGKSSHWYQNGQKKYESYYKNGESSGKCIAWHENGDIFFEGQEIKDKKEGKWVYWYPNKRKMSEINYKNGELNGRSIEWDEYGNKISDKIFVNGYEK